MKADHCQARPNEGTDSGWVRLAAALVVMSTLSACANLGVEPWERDYLAKEEMLLDGDPVDDAMDDHIYFSKEATSGGRWIPPCSSTERAKAGSACETARRHRPRLRR